MTKFLNILYHFYPLFRLSKLYQLEKKYFIDGVLKIGDEILEENRFMREKSIDIKQSEYEDDGFKRKPKNFIRTLLNPENNLSFGELKDEVNTLVGAGHETSALVLSHAFLMLAMHPEVQRKAVVELKEVFGSADARIDYDSMNNLIYLDMVIKETMRLFPVLPLSARKTSDEIQIGEFTIPANATVVVDAISVQRSKKFWGEDADLFRPERFEPESFEKIHSYAFIPFAGGLRLCIGWRYGMLFMKTVLANFLRKYEINSPLKYEDLSFEMKLSMQIVQRCMVTLSEREF